MDSYVPSEQRMDEVTMEDVLEGMILAGLVNPCWPREAMTLYETEAQGPMLLVRVHRRRGQREARRAHNEMR